MDKQQTTKDVISETEQKGLYHTIRTACQSLPSFFTLTKRFRMIQTHDEAVQDIFEEEGANDVCVMEWPVQSPNLKSIKLL